MVRHDVREEDLGAERGRVEPLGRVRERRRRDAALGRDLLLDAARLVGRVAQVPPARRRRDDVRVAAVRLSDDRADIASSGRREERE